MTPRQLRLIYPLTPQPPAKAVGHLVAAYAMWPLCILEAAITGYCERFVEVLDPPATRPAP